MIFKMIKTSNAVSRITALFISVILVAMSLYFCPLNTSASQIAENLTVSINGKEYTVRAMNQDFICNAYLSLRDMAVALSGSEKAIDVSFTKIDDEDAVVIKYGNYSKVGGENVPFDEEAMQECDWIVKNSLKKTKLRINDQDCYFYGIFANNEEGNRDFYLSSGELSIMLDMETEYDNGKLYVYPEKPYQIDVEKLDSDGFFYMSDSCLVGDATTGEIYYSLEEDKAVSIASTTKLMTYFVLMDGVSAGEITLNDRVTFSKNAEQESQTENGVIPLTAGNSAPIDEVMKAMLIKSSNECALALAEHLCGSEEAFVDRMNNKAKELGLSESAHFYNPHGLPFYEKDQVMSAKLQNRLTANDMFILVSELLAIYPQVTDITSIKKVHLDTLNVDIVNTNSLLFNVKEAVGLKTGTTTKAGSCLVAASRVLGKDGTEHYIVTIEYGAESALIQSYTSLVLMKYGLNEFNNSEALSSLEEKKIPGSAEELVRSVLNEAKKSA